MKKAILSLSTMLFAGAVLASCNFSSGVKVSKPKDKGKAVDEVKLVNYYNDEVTIKKDTSLDDLSYYFDYYYDLTDKKTEDTYEFAFTKKQTEKKEVKYTNYVSETNSLVDNYIRQFEEKYSYEVYGYQKENTNSVDLSSYYYSSHTKKETEKLDKVSSSTTYNDAYKKAGFYSYDSTGKKTIDYGVYHDESRTETLKSSTHTETDSNHEITNQYLNTSESPTDENYGRAFYGYDKNRNYVSYRISSFFDEQNIDSFYLGYVYYSEFKDLYDVNLELTDKYIIIKTKTPFIMELYYRFFLADYRYDNNGSYPAEEDQPELYKKYVEKYMKGSLFESEIWISYTDKAVGHDYNDISIAYYKLDFKYNYKKEFEWNDRLFDYRNIYNEELQEKLKGKKLTVTEKGSSLIESAANTNDYSKKIKSTKDNIKKNNDFDNINFKVDNYS